VNGEHRSNVADPNIVTSIWNHRLLIASFIGIFAALGVLVQSLRPTEYAAEAGVVLEDPRAAALSTARIGDELRYVADQVAIFKSPAVAVRASQIARTANPSVSIEPGKLEDNTSIRSSADSNYIVVSHRAADRQTARTGANAVVQAYGAVIRDNLEAEATASLKRLDVAIGATTQTLANAQSERQRTSARALVNELRARRTRVQVNAELTGDGIQSSFPASLGTPQGVSLISALAIAMVLGGLIGTGLAYWLDARKQAFTSWLEPQVLLNAPALAEIPDFTRERVSSKLPVLHAPGTESAEAFRTLASAIGPPVESSKQARAAASRERDEGGRFAPKEATNLPVAFVSASPGDGTTTLAANTAFAAAQEGHRVLALDADIQGQGLSRLLLGRAVTIDGSDTAEGLSNMLRSRSSGETIQRVMGTSAGGTLSLLGPGTATRRRDDVFRSEQILATLESIRDQFDLVIIDVPPMLHFAYADALLRSSGGVVVVVRHRSEASRLRQVRDRLALLGVRPIGYVYNLAPARQDVGRTVGQDVLDRAEHVVGRARKSKRAAAR
jgi:Mrp family chromosome partitioning ATPase/capsular polysaccharide biosynthesis protein